MNPLILIDKDVNVTTKLEGLEPIRAFRSALL